MRTRFLPVLFLFCLGCIEAAPEAGTGNNGANNGMSNNGMTNNIGSPDFGVSEPDMSEPPPPADMGGPDLAGELTLTPSKEYVGMGEPFTIEVTGTDGPCMLLFTIEDPANLERVGENFESITPGRYNVMAECGGQTGHTRVTVLPVAPANVDQVALWLNGNDGLQFDTVRVTRWLDRGPLKNHFDPPPSGSAPTGPTPFNQGDNSGAHFQKGELLVARDSINFVRGYVIMLLRPAPEFATDASGRAWLSTASEPGWTLAYTDPTLLSTFHSENVTVTDRGLVYRTEAGDIGDPHFVIWQLTPTNVTIQGSFSGGTNLAPGAFDGTPPAFTFDVLGTPSRFMNYAEAIGSVAEVIVIEGNNADLGAVQRYLSTKYDL